ncbi:MAG: ATP-binding protein [Chromatiales bacterium]|nr:ATP-binding protein [Chromatiales bacterium]
MNKKLPVEIDLLHALSYTGRMEQTTTASRYRISRPVLYAVIVVLILFVWQVAMLTREQALENLERESRQQLNLYVASLQGQLEKYEFLPELLATNRRLVQLLKDPANPDRIDALNRYLSTINDIADASDTYLMNADGLTIAASNWQSERPFIGRNFSYRPYFKEAMEGKLGRYFALGTTSNRRGYYFAYPVRHQGEILGAVVMKITLATFEQSWKRPESEFIVTDPDGVIFSTTNPGWRFNTLEPLAPDVLKRINDSKRYRDAELRPLAAKLSRLTPDKSELQVYGPKATSFLVLEYPMPEAGWKVHILARLTRVDLQMWRAVFLSVVLFGIVLLILLIVHQRRKRLLDRARFEQQVKRNLEANEAKIRVILENTQAGLLLMDMSGTIELGNSKAHELFGYDFGALKGEHFFGCFSNQSREQIRAIFAGGGSHVSTIEVEALDKDNFVFPVELSIGTLRLSGDSKRIATVHDISYRVAQEEALRQAHGQLEARVEERTKDLTASNTRLMREIEEHRRTEKALRDTQDQLIQAAKLAALGQMSTGISHELNQPLAAIRSYADNARALINNERVDDACWNMEQISGLTERMARISTQLKVFSRKTTGQVVSVSLTAAIENSVQILAPRIRETNTEIDIQLPETELYVMADMVQLEQVLVNLIGNAIHAVEALEKRDIEISAKVQGLRVITRILDSGPGIAEENLTRIFDPFFTTKEEGRGLGLGLSISHRIVDGMNGLLYAANDQQAGAVFTLELPQADAPEDVPLNEQAG